MTLQPSEYTAAQVERFITKVKVGKSCWLWKASKAAHGYGQLRIAGRTKMAHRVAYEIWVGPIPPGHEIDHVRSRGCRFRHCVNPAHLDVVTHGENMRRGRGWSGVNAAKTACPKGHPLDGRSKLGRYCKTCHRDRERERYHRKKSLTRSS